jgi:hypothetical protein
MEGYSVGSVAKNVAVCFKAFLMAGGCNKIENCTIRFQPFVAFVRLQMRIGYSAVCVGNVERIASSRIYKCQVLFSSVSHIVQPWITHETKCIRLLH